VIVLHREITGETWQSYTGSDAVEKRAEQEQTNTPVKAIGIA
jgi:hypothetical protein